MVSSNTLVCVRYSRLHALGGATFLWHIVAAPALDGNKPACQTRCPPIPFQTSMSGLPEPFNPFLSVWFNGKFLTFEWSWKFRLVVRLISTSIATNSLLISRRNLLMSNGFAQTHYYLYIKVKDWIMITLRSPSLESRTTVLFIVSSDYLVGPKESGKFVVGAKDLRKRDLLPSYARK